jgi:DNA-binding NtrC family response regulator
MSANILLVEDDPAARLALSRMLESVGYQVATAPDGSTAITMLSETSFDVVVSDMRLPDIDGVEVLQVATSLPFPPSVVLLTGYGTLDTAIAALRAGASDYLLKPCAR